MLLHHFEIENNGAKRNPIEDALKGKTTLQLQTKCRVNLEHCQPDPPQASQYQRRSRQILHMNFRSGQATRPRNRNKYEMARTIINIMERQSQFPYSSQRKRRKCSGVEVPQTSLPLRSPGPEGGPAS